MLQTKCVRANIHNIPTFVTAALILLLILVTSEANKTSINGHIGLLGSLDDNQTALKSFRKIEKKVVLVYQDQIQGRRDRGGGPLPIIAGWTVKNCRTDGKNWPV